MQLTSFVGREVEVAEVTKLVESTRLVTLLGAGGLGKTRLALQAAAGLVGRFEHGVFLVELAPVADPALIASTLISTLGAREEPGVDAASTLANFLAEREVLLILDNCEHLAAAVAGTAETVLRAAPRVRLLVTSRESLRVPAEHCYAVPPLAIPDDSDVPGMVAAADAARLFCERARAASASFVLTAENSSMVAELCRRLEGIPLALELAAARVRALTPAEIAARLDDRFRLLRGGAARTAPARHQTLEATVGWSHDLLDDTERACFRRLSVFAGGCSLQAAEAVVADDGVDPVAVVDLVGSLVDKSLIVTDEVDGTTRYRMLETIRVFAAGWLAEAGEAAATGDRHLRHYTALAEEADGELRGADQALWLHRLEVEHDNLRAAVAFAVDQRPGAPVLRLAGALGFYWEVRGHWSEGRAALERALHSRGPEVDRLVAKALNLNGRLVERLGDYPAARILYERALAAYQALGDGAGAGDSLGNLGSLAHARGEFAAARALWEKALDGYRNAGHDQGMASSLAGLGRLASEEGDFPTARSLLDESLGLHRKFGDVLGAARCLHTLGRVAGEEGDYPAARSLFELSLAGYRKLGYRLGIASSLGDLGYVAHGEGDYPGARSLYEEALAISRGLGHRAGIATSLSDLGNVAYDQGDHLTWRALNEEALAIFRGLGDRAGIARSLSNLGNVAYEEGDHVAAQVLDEEALAILRDLGDRPGMATCLEHLGNLAHEQGDHEAARSLLGESLSLCREMGLKEQMAWCFERLVGVDLALGRPWHAARLLGASEALRQVLGSPLPPSESARHDRDVAALSEALGTGAYEAAVAEGRAMSLDATLAILLDAKPDEG